MIEIDSNEADSLPKMSLWTAPAIVMAGRNVWV